MRNLARLTGAAQRLTSGPNTHDRRSAPRCQRPGCRRAALWYGEEQYAKHCSEHAMPEELRAYYSRTGVL